MQDFQDDDLQLFAKIGPPPLPPGGETVRRGKTVLWHASWGNGPTVLLLHGGMGNANNFGHQVPALLEAGYRVVVMDSRGHGRSTWNGGGFAYADMAEDALAVLGRLTIGRAAVVGWSDGACAGLAMARQAPERVAGVFFFACNVDAGGALPFVMSERIGRCLERHQKDYAALSPHPDQFDAMSAALQTMQSTQPNYSAEDLAGIAVPVTVAQAEHDEFIRAEHARYLADTIPGARLVHLPGVSHFAPVQRPTLFTRAVLDFLGALAF